MKNIAIILVAGGEAQNKCFWPSYNNSTSGMGHDLIVVHRANKFLPESIKNSSGGAVHYEDKVFEKGELPHKAFGAYRHYFNKYKDQYEYFAFVSDDVIIKSNGWLKKAIDMLEKYQSLGAVGTQIFNGGSKYPHQSHIRAPVWFGRSSALSEIDWEFNSDHEGEMSLSEHLKKAGYASAQVGNKINIAYDALEKNHISQLMENKLRGEGKLTALISDEEDAKINKVLTDKLMGADLDPDFVINSPHAHIAKRHIVWDIEPFNGLVLDSSFPFLSKEDRERVLIYKEGIRILC